MRYGHRNLADVARLMGLTLPPKPIFCRTCVEGKSTRLSLSKRRVEPIYIAPRPAYAWHTDVAGPFSTRTPEGHNLMRLLVDGYSHLRKVEMVSSTADFHIAWENHITSVETDLGRTSIVAQLISDSARYYDSDSLDLLNTKKGIMHLFSPPNTQSKSHRRAQRPYNGGDGAVHDDTLRGSQNPLWQGAALRDVHPESSTLEIWGG